jgi:hypothetical protein
VDRVTEGLLNTWVQNSGAKFSSKSQQFERFVNFIVLSRHHDSQFTVDDFSCGDDGTLGIDGFALSINGELIGNLEELEDALAGKHPIEAAVTLIQTKTSTSFNLGDLSIFADTAIALLTHDRSPHHGLNIQHEMLKKLYEQSSRFTANPICRLYFVTVGNWQGPAPLASKIDDTKERLADSNLFSRVDFHCWGAKEVQKNWRAIDSALEVTIQFDQRTTLPEMQGILEAYLGVLAGRELVKLVTDDDGDIRKALFFDNVRDFQGNTEVNQDIERTLQSDEASRFCVLNNGVTVVARELQITGNKFKLKDFQVVNGCQTSHILHDNRKSLENVFVPFRLIVALDEDVANSITLATNNQSSVTPENLMALSGLQKKIESYFDSFANEDSHRIYYERRSKQWSGSAQVRGTWRIITLRNLMQSFASLYLRIPHTAARYYGDLRTRAGIDVFAKSHHAAYYYSAAYAYCKLDHFFRSEKVARDMKPARYHLLAGIRTLFTGTAAVDSIETTDKKSEAACSGFNQFLWDDADYLDALNRCEKVLRQLAGGKEITRDFGRTRDFTDQYLKTLLD